MFKSCLNLKTKGKQSNSDTDTTSNVSADFVKAIPGVPREADADYESSRTDPRQASFASVRHRSTAAKQAQNCKVHVCTSGACTNDGSRATLVELEELAKLVDGAGGCSLEQYNCFGLCGRGPNVQIEWDDGKTQMFSGARTTEQSLEIIHAACGVRPEASAPLLARMQALRHVSRLQQALAKAQEIVDVLDVSSVEQRASKASQRKYDSALKNVDAVLREAPADAHPLRRLAEAVRRQVVAARACRPVSPEVEDVEVDDPSTWP